MQERYTTWSERFASFVDLNFSLQISTFVSSSSDSGHKVSFDVLDEFKAAGEQSSWTWKCSVQRYSLPDKLVTGVTGV